MRLYPKPAIYQPKGEPLESAIYPSKEVNGRMFCTPKGVTFYPKYSCGKTRIYAPKRCVDGQPTAQCA